MVHDAIHLETDYTSYRHISPTVWRNKLLHIEMAIDLGKSSLLRHTYAIPWFVMVCFGYVESFLDAFLAHFRGCDDDVIRRQDFSAFSHVCLGECPVMVIYWLVVEPYPSEKYVSSSVGMMTFPIYGQNEIHVPNHKPVMHDLRDITDITWCSSIWAVTFWTSWSMWFSFFLKQDIVAQSWRTKFDNLV